MRISKLRIENYRNLDGVAISFDEDVTYIVGENNLGKTNVLDLLNTIFNQATIGEEDFADTEKRSGAVVTLKMDEDEIGISGPTSILRPETLLPSAPLPTIRILV